MKTTNLLIAILFAIIPAIWFGLITGFIFQDIWIGLASLLFLFGLGLDVLLRPTKPQMKEEDE